MFLQMCLVAVLALQAADEAVVEGTVVDARTGQPVAGAIVSPVVFCPPVCVADKKHGVVTDAEGRFTLERVDPTFGVSVWHNDYLEFNSKGSEELAEKTADNRYTTRVELEKGETLFGVIRDASGRTLAQVEVSDGSGKQVKSGQDGTFTLRSPTRWWDDDSYSLSFKKAEYLDRRFITQSTAPEGFSIVLEPRPFLVGRVVDGDGRPVSRYTVVAGAGREPRNWQCSTAEIDDVEGRFALHVKIDRDYEKQDKVWIAVRAPGCAVWETVADSWKGTRSMTAALTRGVSVHGAIKGRERFAGLISATLEPVSIHERPATGEAFTRRELGKIVAQVDDSGEFRFDHVAPGEHILAIAGPTVSPTSTLLTVGDAHVNAGYFPLSARGSIAGAVFRPDVIGALAAGQIFFRDSSGRRESGDFEHLRPIRFKTDQQGRFHVEDVPVGLVSVEFPCMMSADVMRGVYSRTAQVVEGQATEVRFFDTSGHWDVPFQFVVGDGSAGHFATGTGAGAKRHVHNVTIRPPTFRIHLMPKDVEPRSFSTAGWEETDEEHRIVLPDVHPGEYRFVVDDWLGSARFKGQLCDKHLTVTAHTEVQTISLGAGSVTGAVLWSKELRDPVRVVAVGRQMRTVREARCDSHGSFCVRYLPPDVYTLFAHDDEAGWCRLPDTSVNNDIPDVGTHQLAPGDTIVGELSTRFGSDVEIAVAAIDANGITMGDPAPPRPRREGFKIAGLWPGKWTVTVKKAEQLLAKSTVELRGTETLSCQLSGN